MNRTQIRSWFEAHPGAVHGNLDDLLQCCEREVRRNAGQAAWQHAHEIAEGRLHDWETAPGMPASEAFVAREVCHRFASELRGRWPHVEAGDEDRLAGPEILDRCIPEAREPMRQWIHDLAEQEEHRTWVEILRFTDRRGSTLVKEGRVSDELTWDIERSYSRAAQKVMELLLRDYERSASQTR
jgi:hypothetical protein